uniref:Uncharacterized protein n=1 Tax=Acrobeloides nanus TaxID=290746 RepID=A0A914E7U0_9BILA
MVYMAGCRNELLPTAFGNVETWFILEDNGTLSGVTLILNRNYILGIRVGASIIFYNEHRQKVFQSDWSCLGNKVEDENLNDNLI